MREKIEVTFIHHSGFLIETENSYLIFDYLSGDIPELSRDKTLYVFVSHAHRDHYSKEIFGFEKWGHETYYIMSDDIRRRSSFWKEAGSSTFMKPKDEKKVGACHVTAFNSTDEGIAFLVEIDGWTFFHAGDLHWWDWPGDPVYENFMMKKRFCAEIDLLQGKKIDAAFVVLDPRQEESGSLGMEYFVSHVDADYVFPMHFWQDYDYVKDFYDRKKALLQNTHFMLIRRKGQSFEIPTP